MIRRIGSRKGTFLLQAALLAAATATVGLVSFQIIGNTTRSSATLAAQQRLDELAGWVKFALSDTNTCRLALAGAGPGTGGRRYEHFIRNPADDNDAARAGRAYPVRVILTSQANVGGSVAARQGRNLGWINYASSTTPDRFGEIGLRATDQRMRFPPFEYVQLDLVNLQRYGGRIHGRRGGTGCDASQGSSDANLQWWRADLRIRGIVQATRGDLQELFPVGPRPAVRRREGILGSQQLERTIPVTLLLEEPCPGWNLGHVNTAPNPDEVRTEVTSCTTQDEYTQWLDPKGSRPAHTTMECIAYGGSIYKDNLGAGGTERTLCMMPVRGTVLYGALVSGSIEPRMFCPLYRGTQKRDASYTFAHRGFCRPERDIQDCGPDMQFLDSVDDGRSSFSPAWDVPGSNPVFLQSVVGGRTLLTGVACL